VPNDDEGTVFGTPREVRLYGGRELDAEGI